MGYIKQGNNMLVWGVIGKVNPSSVIATKNGNVPKKNFSVCIDTNEKNEKVWAQIECWGAQTLREDIKQWNSVFLGGKLMSSEYTSRQTGEKKTKNYIRAEFIQVNPTAKAFEQLAKAKDDTTEIDDNDSENSDLPF